MVTWRPKAPPLRLKASVVGRVEGLGFSGEARENFDASFEVVPECIAEESTKP